MPHSSGGSSSSGSVTGGSSGEGLFLDSILKNRVRVKKHPFSGCSRYVLYKDMKYRSYYTSGRIKKTGFRVFTVIIAIFLALIGSFFLVKDVAQSFSYACPISTKDINTTIYIEDDCNYLSSDEERALESCFKEVLNKTGVTMALVTVDNSYKDNSITLESYTYDKYLKMFEDESHWLLVYYQDGANEWAFEGMQGCNTDRILTQHITKKFNKTLDEELRQYSDNDAIVLSDAIQKAVDAAIPEPDTVIINNKAKSSLIAASFITVFMVADIAYIVTEIKKQKALRLIKKAGIKIPRGKIYEHKCEFCGGIYIVGTVTRCPYCGSAVTIHNVNEDEITEK